MIGDNNRMLLEPGSTPLAEGLFVIPMLIGTHQHLFPVQVANVFAEGCLDSSRKTVWCAVSGYLTPV